MAQLLLIENAKPFISDCVGCARRLFVGPGWRIVAGDRAHAICDECAFKVDPTITVQRDRSNGRLDDSMPPTIVETRRLLLREFVPDDAAAFYELNRDPEVVRHTGEGNEGPQSVEEARAVLVARPIADYRRFGFGRCACVCKETGELVGMCGLKYLDDLGVVDLGYRFQRTSWGRGLATEAARAMVELGFGRLSLGRIVGLVEPGHTPSIRVLEKVGMRFDRMVDYRGDPVAQYVVLAPEPQTL